MEVLWAIAEYGGNQQAADALSITLQTVKNHTNAIIRKMGSTTTLQAYHRLTGGRRMKVTTTTTVDYEFEEEPR